MVNPREIIADKDSVTRREFEGVLRSRGMGRDEREAADLEVLSERLNSLSRALGHGRHFGGRI